MTGQRKHICSIGTSGWSYNHWQDVFYPESLKKSDYFSFYLRHFTTVELNNSFYHLPSPEALKTWNDQSPEDFIFSIKASRYITHMKKLNDPGEALATFFDRINILQSKAEVVLFQLPPRWHCNLERLRTFIALLPSGRRYSFEFRDQSWYREEVYELLEKNNLAYCMYELNGHQSPKVVTADYVYIRLHGPDGPYQGSYSDQELSGWAGAISSWISLGKDCYFYFDNDQNGYAVKNALRLKEMLNGA